MDNKIILETEKILNLITEIEKILKPEIIITETTTENKMKVNPQENQANQLKNMYPKNKDPD